LQPIFWLSTVITKRNTTKAKMHPAATKEKDVTKKTLAQTISVQAVTDGISWRITSG